ncbi:chromosomal replication initiator protein DnaA [Parasphaerochaeta coccoides]|uniref:Chromosomal replication initiator protein DnaA n=1 Tax=Parasphaerochaeta coccoides (strain ATCC BAA-1237 / DSM 17374 / SPN1) TaxID=760011 RepID=F4GI84_PARC1|nr:chromosomal replication initiator protein DnaA [Parasphaerochaeta coccoides]AEC01243.1 chromosomal replication initiator protein DnaA [Parasphaerochaeta coccoides DSM 17374]
MSHVEENYSVFWLETEKRLKETISPTDYTVWISRIRYEGAAAGKLMLSVPSQFVYDKVDREFRSQITDIISDLTGEHIKVEFVIKKISAPSPAAPFSGGDDEENETKKPHAEVSRTEKERIIDYEASNLNPLYRFENFIAGENSAFAYSAAMAISKNPGVTYNPCLVYGGVGLGKTHLLQSIGNYILENNPELKVVYVTAEMFTNEFIQSIGDKKTQAFKNKYRKVGVLLIDDIHFLQGKDSTQEELFHTFNDLYDTHKQLVFTCDRPISELKDLTSRLRSRFERGLNVDLLPPNYETRMAILKRKSAEKNMSIPDDVLDFISRNVNTNVRDLEASLTKLIAYSTLLNKEITLDIAKEQLKAFPAHNAASPSLSIETIIRVVSDYFNVSTYDVKGKKKTKSLIQPRQIAMYLARILCEYSTSEIGSEFGGKDHSTVMHAYQRVEGMIKTDEALNQTVQKLIREIRDYKKN